MLPTNEHGEINTSADYGVEYVVEVFYNTDEHGEPAMDGVGWPRTLHGPFTSVDEAAAWINAYPDDTDVYDMQRVVLNRVRPTS